MELKVKAFETLAEEIISDNPEINKIYLIKSTINDDWGLLMVDATENQSQVDNHCQQCFENFYPFRLGPTNTFPYNHLSVTISLDKFNALMSGQIALPKTLKLENELMSR